MGATDVGRARSGNEDFHLLAPDLGLFAVCDGMGGHAAGEVASRMAAEALRAHVAQNLQRVTAGAGEQVLREAIESANRAVHEHAERSAGSKGMGTTCTAVLVRGDDAYLGHVGDSRLYLLREGKLEQLTQDHNYAHEAVRAGILSPQEARRSPFAGRITRAVGVRDTVAVDTLRFALVDGDTLMLCSDGVHQYADRIPLAQMMADAPGPAARGLVEAANEAGGSDNATAIVLRTSATEPAQRTRKTEICSDLAMLQNVIMFRDLTMRERCAVMNRFRAVEVPPGQVVIHQGEPSDSLFVVVAGRLEVRRNDAQIATLQPGTHFGEMSLLSQRPRSATIRAVEDVRLLELTRADFLDLVARDAAVGAKFLWRLAQMLSTRLDDVYLMLPEVDGRRTQELASLTPFER